MDICRGLRKDLCEVLCENFCVDLFGDYSGDSFEIPYGELCEDLYPWEDLYVNPIRDRMILSL